jgi:hypothetical protein
VFDTRRGDSVFVGALIFLGSGSLTEIYRGPVNRSRSNTMVSLSLVKRSDLLDAGPPQGSQPHPGQCDGGGLSQHVHAPASATLGSRHLLAGRSLHCVAAAHPVKGTEFKIQTLCWIASAFVAIGIAAPVLLRRPEFREKGALGYVPGASQNSFFEILSCHLGSVLLVSFSVGTAAFEMMIRDQVLQSLLGSPSLTVADLGLERAYQLF